MKELILKLSEFESIKIVTDYKNNFKDVNMCCDPVKVYFIDEQLLRIGQETAGEVFEHLISSLKYVVDNKLQLHKTIIQNLGFMENEYSHKSSDENNKFFMIPTTSGKSSYWIGSKYEIWTTYADAYPYVNTWMYNDQAGNIILEVTKFYKWSTNEDDLDEDDLNDSNYITYDEFMKDYKPLIHKIIPRDVAIQWLKQSMEVYRSFFSSEENYQEACKRLNW